MDKPNANASQLIYRVHVYSNCSPTLPQLTSICALTQASAIKHGVDQSSQGFECAPEEHPARFGSALRSVILYPCNKSAPKPHECPEES